MCVNERACLFVRACGCFLVFLAFARVESDRWYGCGGWRGCHHRCLVEGLVGTFFLWNVSLLLPRLRGSVCSCLAVMANNTACV